MFHFIDECVDLYGLMMGKQDFRWLVIPLLTFECDAKIHEDSIQTLD